MEDIYVEINAGHIKFFGDEIVEQSMFECIICNCNISGLTQAKLHALGGKHKKNLKKTSVQQLSKNLNEEKNFSDRDRSPLTTLLEEKNIKIASATGTQGDGNLNSNDGMSKNPKECVTNTILPKTTCDSRNNTNALSIADGRTDITGDYNCKICEKTFNGPQQLDSHLQGKLHKKKLVQHGTNPDIALQNTTNYSGYKMQKAEKIELDTSVRDHGFETCKANEPISKLLLNQKSLKNTLNNNNG